ncbi:MAG TPA: hypothetical protein VFX20_21155 [Steroidobacteraceae bacterium]|nr:hypothetical protein [Steroidobacteraceae bacterium]
MSDISDCVAFLERLGADAALARATPGELACLLADAGIGAAAAAAILSGDNGSLARLLEAPATVCCLIAPGEEEEEEEPEEDEEDEEEGEEEDEEDEEDEEEAEPGTARPPWRNLAARRGRRAA